MPTAQDHHPHLPPGALLAHLHHPCPWHRGSLFGEGPRRPLSADQRRAWLARTELERRAGNLSALHVEVARALLKRLGADGQCDPSHASLAADAGASESTVQRALNALRELKLLAWERRLVRRPWPEGGPGATRAEQTSNAYELLLPNGPATVRVRRPVQLRLRCDRQAGCEISSEMIPRGLPPLDEAERQRLEAIQTARKARLDQEWLARRAARWHRRD